MTSGRWFVRSQSTESSALRAILRVSRGGSSFESERCIAFETALLTAFTSSGSSPPGMPCISTRTGVTSERLFLFTAHAMLATPCAPRLERSWSTISDVSPTERPSTSTMPLGTDSPILIPLELSSIDSSVSRMRHLHAETPVASASWHVRANGSLHREPARTLEGARWTKRA